MVDFVFYLFEPVLVGDLLLFFLKVVFDHLPEFATISLLIWIFLVSEYFIRQAVLVVGVAYFHVLLGLNERVGSQIVNSELVVTLT